MEEERPDLAASLSHVLGELKRFQLTARVTHLEVSARGITLLFEGSTPTARVKSAAEQAMERAEEEEAIMYGSAGT